MPIHQLIEHHKLLDEVRLLERGGMTVRFIVPQVVETMSSINHNRIVKTYYSIIFDEPDDAKP